MSIIEGRSARLHHFFRSGPSPCPYLPGRVERKLFTRPAAVDLAAANSELSIAGFRRSHDTLYRPICPSCTACVPVRIPVDRFAPSRSLRRIIRRNQDLQMIKSPPRYTPGHYALFARYQRARHGGSEMARMTADDYAAMVGIGGATARLYTLVNPHQAIVGAVLTDRLDDGFSAVYSFYEPATPQRSLGTFLVLELIRLAEEAGLPHVYLGYWIDGADKMAYKKRFHPMEGLFAHGWADLPSPADG